MCHKCGKEGQFARDVLLAANQDHRELDALSAVEWATEGNHLQSQNQGRFTTSLLVVNPVCAYHVAHIWGDVRFMLDMGAAVSLLRKNAWDNVGSEHQLIPWTGPRLVGVQGTPLEVHGVATLEILLAGKAFLVDFVVVAVPRTQSILGRILWRTTNA